MCWSKPVRSNHQKLVDREILDGATAVDKDYACSKIWFQLENQYLPLVSVQSILHITMFIIVIERYPNSTELTVMAPLKERPNRGRDSVGWTNPRSSFSRRQPKPFSCWTTSNPQSGGQSGDLVQTNNTITINNGSHQLVFNQYYIIAISVCSALLFSTVLQIVDRGYI